MSRSRNLGLELKLKRLLDIFLAILSILLFSPLLVIIPVAIKLDSKGSIFFKQRRPGKDANIFLIYKFRTMKEQVDNDGSLLPDEKRLTKIGRFLRKFSLDEVPELWNVLKDDMSMVGPRPLLIEYLDKYSPEQARRHEVKPGITGWAQVNGRNAITWQEKFNYDVWYIDNWSLWLDIKILFITLIKVIKGEGISQYGRATMEKFEGNRQQS